MSDSLFNDDLYKLTMLNAVLDHFPDVDVEYEFKDRAPTGLMNDDFLKGVKEDIERMANVRATDKELRWLPIAAPYLSNPHFISYLKDYQFDPNEVNPYLDAEGVLRMPIKGKWARTILWEVRLLGIVSRRYFMHCDTDWTMDGQVEQAGEKARRLSEGGVLWADFGTRRRRNPETQDIVVREMKKYSGFLGTSNVHLAHKYGVKPIGTMAHEWIMGCSAMDGLLHANRFALTRWKETFKGRVGVALPDTYGLDAFRNDFDAELARVYDGTRHDSGDPKWYGHAMEGHYKSLGIRTQNKGLTFSNDLNVDSAIDLTQHFKDIFYTTCGIGTHLTNDFRKASDPTQKSSALKIVIKLSKCNGLYVVKLSDDEGKAQGNPDAIRVAEWYFRGKPLDS